LLLVVLMGLPIAAILFAGAFGLLDELGRGSLFTEEPPAPSPPLSSPAGRFEREEEIRQLLQARSDRRVARGEPGLDVEAEVQRLLQSDEEMMPGVHDRDAALREEVRQLVVARNERRFARGEPPLDVDEEIERQLRDAGAL
jgi:hypothetical protein